MISKKKQKSKNKKKQKTNTKLPSLTDILYLIFLIL